MKMKCHNSSGWNVRSFGSPDRDLAMMSERASKSFSVALRISSLATIRSILTSQITLSQPAPYSDGSERLSGLIGQAIL